MQGIKNLACPTRSSLTYSSYNRPQMQEKYHSPCIQCIPSWHALCLILINADPSLTGRLLYIRLSWYLISKINIFFSRMSALSSSQASIRRQITLSYEHVYRKSTSSGDHLHLSNYQHVRYLCPTLLAFLTNQHSRICHVRIILLRADWGMM